jgi:hypothetical protein
VRGPVTQWEITFGAISAKSFMNAIYQTRKVTSKRPYNSCRSRHPERISSIYLGVPLRGNDPQFICRQHATAAKYA